MPPIPKPSIHQLIKLGKIKVNRKSPNEHIFWSKVNKDGPIHPVCGQCWIWTGFKDKDGYGGLSVNNKPMRAHRYSYRLHNKDFNETLNVLHHCDTPSCVNPSHLFEGTTADNNADMHAKNRYKIGEDHGRAKFTDDQIREIRRRYKPRHHKDGASAMAREFGVYVLTITFIVKRKTWRHLS